MSRYSRLCAMSRYSRRCASSTSPKGSTACREAVTGCGDAEVEKAAARRRRAPVSTTTTSRQPLRLPPRQSPRPLKRPARCRRRILHRGDRDAATKRSFSAKATPPRLLSPPISHRYPARCCNRCSYNHFYSISSEARPTSVSRRASHPNSDPMRIPQEASS